jgi:hypothetical protein
MCADGTNLQGAPLTRNRYVVARTGRRILLFFSLKLLPYSASGAAAGHLERHNQVYCLELNFQNSIQRNKHVTPCGMNPLFREQNLNKQAIVKLSAPQWVYYYCTPNDNKNDVIGTRASSLTGYRVHKV